MPIRMYDMNDFDLCLFYDFIHFSFWVCGFDGDDFYCGDGFWGGGGFFGSGFESFFG